MAQVAPGYTGKTRIPFIGLPSGCDPLDFDIDIVPSGFSYCTVTAISEPPAYPFTFHVDIPDIVVAPFCPCLKSAAASAGAQIEDDGRIRVAIIPGSDCCSLALDLDISLHVPCLPFTMEGTGNVEFPACTQSLAVEVAKDPNTCRFDIDVDLKLPCFPFSVEMDGTLQNITGFIDLVQEPDCGSGGGAACKLKLQYDLAVGGFDIPCESGFDAAATGTLGGGLTGYINLIPPGSGQTKCTFILEYNLDINLSAIGVQCAARASGTIGEFMTGDIDLVKDVSIGPSGTALCEYVLQYNLDAIPQCPDVNNNVVIGPGLVGNLELVRNFVADPWFCEILLEGDLRAVVGGGGDIVGTATGTLGTCLTGAIDLDVVGGGVSVLPSGTQVAKPYFINLGYNINIDPSCICELCGPADCEDVCTCIAAGTFLTKAFVDSVCVIGHDEQGLNQDIYNDYMLNATYSGGVIRFDFFYERYGHSLGHLINNTAGGSYAYQLTLPQAPFQSCADVCECIHTAGLETNNDGYIDWQWELQKGPNCTLDMFITMGIDWGQVFVDYGMDCSGVLSCILQIHPDIPFDCEDVRNCFTVGTGIADFGGGSPYTIRALVGAGLTVLGGNGAIAHPAHLGTSLALDYPISIAVGSGLFRLFMQGQQADWDSMGHLTNYGAGAHQFNVTFGGDALITIVDLAGNTRILDFQNGLFQ